MGKDKRDQRRACLRCENWAEEGSELCAACEEESLQELAQYEDRLDQERADSLEGGE